MKYIKIVLILITLSSNGTCLSGFFHRAASRLGKLLRFESRTTAPNAYTGGGHAFISRPSKGARLRYNTSLLLEYATREARQRGGFEDITAVPDAEEDCEESPCDFSYRYRRMDGRCNNFFENERYGSRLRVLARILRSEYEDGISRPRVRSSSAGGNVFLPGARAVSNAVHAGGSNATDKRHSLMLMQWGQFLDHDISFTPNIRSIETNAVFDCRACDSAVKVHPSCLPILIPRDDPYFPVWKSKSKRERSCMAFSRSVPGQTTLGSREQINQNTAYIDFSQVYGSSSCSNGKLRSSVGGKLSVLSHPLNRYLKPLMPMVENVVMCQAHAGLCFSAGDDRSNEQPGLASMHTIFVRQHNTICDYLKIYNPKWDDEKLFQEASRIVRAIGQHITYNEFLPRVLGPGIMKRYDLSPRAGGYYGDYDVKCSADVFNEFSSAAFRFGHSLISPAVKMVVDFLSKEENREEPVKIRSHFNNPDVVRNINFIDHFVTGLASQGTEPSDSKIAFDIRNRLFEEHNRSDSFIDYSGMDLAALNIQRAREHGIPGYIKYRKWCRKREKIRNFDDLEKVLQDSATVKKLKSVYKRVEDIDLFAGGLSERPLPGALVGPTFACIIGLQFRKLRKCDRFWYESPMPGLRFTTDQLNQIRNITLSSVICRNMENPRPVQRSVMDLPDSDKNPKLDCDVHPKIDFKFWKEKGSRNTSQDVRYCETEGRVIPAGSRTFIGPCTECECTDEGELKCQSAVVESCSDLEFEVGREYINSNKACYEQCS